MSLDIEGALSKEEIESVMENCRSRLASSRKKGVKSGTTLLIIIAISSPFYAGMPLHRFWEPVGQLLLLMTMASFLYMVYCFAIWWGAWSHEKEFKKTYLDSDLA